MIYKNNDQGLIYKWSIRSIIIICIITLMLNIVPYSGTGQHQGDIGMEGADVIVVKEHYISLIQDQSSPNKLFYEEEIFYQNIGNESYSGKLYTWSPEYLQSLFKPVITTNGTEYETDKLEPTLNFLYLNLSKEKISIKPNETLKVIFKFNLDYKSTDKFTFRRVFLYNNKNIIITIKTNTKYKVEGGEGLEFYYQPTEETYANKQHGAFTREFGESISILFSKKSSDPDQNGDGTEKDSNLNLIFIIVLIIIICLVVIIYFRYRTTEKSAKKQKTLPKKRESSKSKNSTAKTKRIHNDKKIQKSNIKKERTEKPDTESNLINHSNHANHDNHSSRKKLVQEKKVLLKTSERIKKDYKDGLISKEIFDNLRSEYKMKLKKINKKLENFEEEPEPSPEMKKLLVKKEKILNAINKLEDDRNSGDLDEEMYKEMAGTYKKQAIEILKKIDILKERES